MIERLAVWQDAFYEGNSNAVRTVHSATVISPVSCDFISTHGRNEAIFREDSFDPVTRIRRGRLYVDKTGIHNWDQVKIDSHNTYNWGNLRPTASYESWQPGNNKKIDGSIIQIGTGGFETKWRIVGLEKIYIGHILLTLRANSLLGVIPELVNGIADKDGNAVDPKPVQTALDSLVDTFHRQQATPTVDVARETVRVVLAAWVGESAEGKDLGKVINDIPKGKDIARWAASIVNRLHPRGKSAQHEQQAAEGVTLRPVAWEDAEISVHLVGMLLREIRWAQP